MAPHQQYLSTTIGKFVDEYVMPSLPFDLNSTKKQLKIQILAGTAFTTMPADLLLVEEFNDAVHVRDGE